MRKLSNHFTSAVFGTYFSAVPWFSALIMTWAAVSGQGAAVTPGNLIIYRVGTAGGNLATGISLAEYTPAGVNVQSIPVHSTGPDRMTAVGNATTEGIISRSQDGTKLIFTGYRKDTTSNNPAADSYLVTPRVIGTLTAAGTVNTATSITNDGGSTAANTIRSATSVDGTTAFWVSTSARISYNDTPFAVAGTTQIDARNSRQVSMSGDTLFAANGSTAITGKVQHYGTLPVGATVATPIVSLTTADAVNGFVLLDLDSGVAGDDTLYALSTVANQLVKYTLTGTTWTASGSMSAGGAANLTGTASGGTVKLFLTSATSLFAFTDASGYVGTLTGSLGAAVAAAGANTAFRGVGMFPVTGPVLSIRREGTAVAISWQPVTPGSVLYSATSVTGLWSTAASQANPQTNSTAGDALFYKLAP